MVGDNSSRVDFFQNKFRKRLQYDGAWKINISLERRAKGLIGPSPHSDWTMLTTTAQPSGWAVPFRKLTRLWCCVTAESTLQPYRREHSGRL
jgi:hypothetical protein